MVFYVLTLFPEMIEDALQHSVIGRALENEHIYIKTINIRDFSDNKHLRVDDYPYGGGAGMVMQAEPVARAIEYALEEIKKEAPDLKVPIIYMTPQGKVFNQRAAKSFSKYPYLIFLCGHYEGIDERVLETYVTHYLSIGDYVLTGGELPALVVIDSIARLLPKVLGNELSFQDESFQEDFLLEHPQYTRPALWRNKTVPEILLSGHHEKIENYRQEERLRRTKERRPDLYSLYIEKK